ncbi:MAG: hypothetical protein OSB19_15135 [Opitutaceae bacterium]|mgnify:CR=1 FL=1|nr:hypothetical protein [Opitutaceae bacterium]
MNLVKRSRKKLLSWSALGVALVVVLVLVLGSGFSGCATFSIERSEAENRFHAKGLNPPGNADYVERVMTGVNSMDVQRIDGLNHFVPWSRPDLIREAIVYLAGSK